MFSRLHERRVDVVADLYAKLVDAEIAFGSWVRPIQVSGESSLSDKADIAAKAGEAFQSAFLHRRIWLDEDLCDRLDTFNRKLFEAFVDFTTYKPDDPRTHSEYVQTWLSAWKRVDEDVAPLRKEIESRFRDLLGVVVDGAGRA